MTPTIRTAGAGDERALAELNACVHDVHVRNRPQDFKPAALDDVADWFRNLLGAPTAWIWIAESDREAVGYVLAFAQDRAETLFCRARRWVEIDQIAVRSDRRRNGLARSLVDTVRRAAQARGIANVELTCWHFNRDAQDAFRRLGFTPRVSRFGWSAELPPGDADDSGMGGAARAGVSH